LKQFLPCEDSPPWSSENYGFLFVPVLVYGISGPTPPFRTFSGSQAFPLSPAILCPISWCPLSSRSVHRSHHFLCIDSLFWRSFSCPEMRSYHSPSISDLPVFLFTLCLVEKSTPFILPTEHRSVFSTVLIEKTPFFSRRYGPLLVRLQLVNLGRDADRCFSTILCKDLPYN